MTFKHNGYLRSLLILLLMATMPVCMSFGEVRITYKDPFEPTVTKKEADLLQKVMALSTTNVSMAIDLLKSEPLENASPALDFALGNIYFQSEEFESAINAYKAALQKLPKFRRAIMNLGRVYLLQDKPKNTIGLYQQLVVDGQVNADILILLGHALTLEGHIVSAENAYRQALLLRPDDFEAKLGLVKCLFYEERYREGNNLIKEALNQKYDRKELWSLRANAFLALDQADEAITALELAHRLKQADSTMLSMLGDLYLNKHQFNEAIACYEEAFLKDEPVIKHLLRAIEGFLMLKKTEHASRLFEKAEKLKSEKPKLFQKKYFRKYLRLKGSLAQQLGERDSAIKIYKQLLEVHPLDGRVLLSLGDLYWEKGILEEALMVYERVARIDGFESKALIRQAKVETEREHYQKAVKLLEGAQAFEEQPHITKYLEQVRRMAKYRGNTV